MTRNLLRHPATESAEPRPCLSILTGSNPADAESAAHFLDGKGFPTPLHTVPYEEVPRSRGYVILFRSNLLDLGADCDLVLDEDEYVFVAVFPSAAHRVPERWLAKENVYLWTYTEPDDLCARCLLTALVLDGRTDIPAALAEMYSPDLLFYAARQYDEGLIVATDPATAASLTELAAERGSVRALKFLGDKLLAEGRADEALATYLRIEQPDGKNLGRNFCHKVLKMIPAENAEARFRWLGYAADCGDTDALLQLRDCYAKGIGTAPDADKARAIDEYYHSAVDVEAWQEFYERYHSTNK